MNYEIKRITEQDDRFILVDSFYVAACLYKHKNLDVKINHWINCNNKERFRWFILIDKKEKEVTSLRDKDPKEIKDKEISEALGQTK